jgi:hypothetical protein
VQRAASRTQKTAGPDVPVQIGRSEPEFAEFEEWMRRPMVPQRIEPGDKVPKLRYECTRSNTPSVSPRGAAPAAAKRACGLPSAEPASSPAKKAAHSPLSDRGFRSYCACSRSM